MTRLSVPRPWERRLDRPVLDESLWPSRRQVVKALGLGGAMLAGGPALACQRGPATSGIEDDPVTEYAASTRWVPSWAPAGGKDLYPAKRNEAYRIRRSLNPEDAAASYNNFYEFLPGGAGPVHEHVGGYVPEPWKVAIAGEVEEERTVDLDDIARIAPLEERLYHFRCVERWSMVVPWIGIPLAKFVEWCKPKGTAKYVRFLTFGPEDLTDAQKAHTPQGFEKASYYPWPYFEGLRMDEAVNELSLLVTGIYGHGLPMQHGAPLRVIVPWKYGYKSPKSIARVEFTREEPPTFWNQLQPKEYGFLSNVDPGKPHPRWSQAEEWDITTRETMPTLLYNGYAESVASLYG
jgi:sulfoxide reductase catalytic subunit YedY